MLEVVDMSLCREAGDLCPSWGGGPIFQQEHPGDPWL